MVGRVRLWSAYVLFFYVVTHLLNHALGLISLRVLEVGRTGFVFIWHNPLGQTVSVRGPVHPLLPGPVVALPPPRAEAVALGMDAIGFWAR